MAAVLQEQEGLAFIGRVYGGICQLAENQLGMRKKQDLIGEPVKEVSPVSFEVEESAVYTDGNRVVGIVLERNIGARPEFSDRLRRVQFTIEPVSEVPDIQYKYRDLFPWFDLNRAKGFIAYTRFEGMYLNGYIPGEGGLRESDPSQKGDPQVDRLLALSPDQLMSDCGLAAYMQFAKRILDGDHAYLAEYYLQKYVSLVSLPKKFG